MIGRFNQWRLNESGERSVEEKISDFLEGLGEWIEEETYFADQALAEVNGNSIEIQLSFVSALMIHFDGDEFPAIVDLTFRITINTDESDEDVRQLRNLGLIDETSVISGIECDVKIEISSREIPHELETTTTISIQPEDFFPLGRFDSPDYEFFRTLLEKSGYRDQIKAYQDELGDGYGDEDEDW
jgi:hypothetical protein